MLKHLKNILRSLDEFVGEYPNYIYLVDRSGHVLWVNRYFIAQVKKMNPELGETDFEKIWDDHEVFGDPFQDKNIQTGKAQKHLIKKNFGGDGEELFIEFLSLPVRKPGGQIEGVLRIGFDVSDIQKAQIELREKEELFTSIINSSADAIIFLDSHERIVSWNKGAESIFGYTADEIIGKSNLQLIPGEVIDSGELDYIHNQLKTKNFIRKYETKRLTKDGKIIYVDLTRTIVHDKNGVPIGVSEIIKDTTKGKELEFELLRTIVELSKINELNEILYATHEQEEILQLILIAITAGEGLRFNRAFLFLIDKKADLLKGHLAIGPSNKEEAEVIWNNLNKYQGPLREVVQHYRIDLKGSDRMVNEIVKQIQIPLSRRAHLFIEALNSRRAYQIRNGQLLDGQTFRFDMRNSEFLELFETDSFVVVPLYTKKEPIGIIVADNRITGREISSEDVESLKLFASQASSAIEKTALYHNLELRVEQLQKMNVQLKEQQEKLVRAERLAAIGEMSATIAHEIRNPLVSIGGFANLIEKRLPPGSDVDKYARIIREQVQNLESILNNILSLANPPKPKKQAVDVDQIIQQVVQVLNTAMDRRNIALTLDLNCSDKRVSGDEKMLYQAFLNLLKNAMEALEALEYGGEISISSQCLNEKLEIKFTDNGPGVEPEIADKIFETFVTTKSGGTGLGLPIVRQIVESHHGEIEIKSVPNSGTTILLRFPVFEGEKKLNHSERITEESKQ